MKSASHIIVWFLFIVILAACSPQPCCESFDVMVRVTVKNQNGDNLLTSTTPGAYLPDEVRLFYIKNGVKSQVVNDNSHHYEVTKEPKGSEFFIFTPDLSTIDPVSTFVIQWRTNDEDTIECTTVRTKNSTTCSHVKCNGVTKYDISANGATGRLIEIIK